jgi:hypothetical protein
MSLKYIGVLFAFAVLVSSCERKDSEDRFEEACGIEFPSGNTVLKDQFADAGKDYGILYNVLLTDDGMKEYTGNIRSAKNFTTVDSGKNNIWLPKENGYSFYLAKEGIFYKLVVDTTTNIVTCSEQG